MAGRRSWILGVSTLALLGAVGLYAERQRRWRSATAQRDTLVTRPSGVPVGSFGANSTAEDVTRGLDLQGRTILITGVTSGIGRETMRVLAMRGAHVIGTGRSSSGARDACRSVGGTVTPVVLDLADRDSIVGCAREVRMIAPKLDAIICNAGIMALQQLEQVDGVEKQFAVNHLGHFLLVNHLLAALLEAPQGRVVTVSSQVLSWSDPSGIEWDNLSGEKAYDPNRAYGQSKLANALFSLELANRLRGTSVTSNSLHPGYVDTNLFRHFPLSFNGFRGVFSRSKKIGMPRGAATSCYVATAPALMNSTGCFFIECNPVVPDARATDSIAAKRLWEVSEDLVSAHLPTGKTT